MKGAVELGSMDRAFARGGNRLCFFHPDNDAVCIKIPRPDRMPEIRRQQKSILKRFRPLSYFDENNAELKEITAIEKNVGNEAFDCIPRCYGWVQTDLGLGLALELIRDKDGRVAITLKQYLWVYGMTETLSRSLECFYSRWVELGIPSKDLLLHNIVVQQAQQNDESYVERLVVIDGLGWAGLNMPFLSKRKAAKKIRKLSLLIDSFMKKEKNESTWGYHGWLDEDQRVNNK